MRAVAAESGTAGLGPVGVGGDRAPWFERHAVDAGDLVVGSELGLVEGLEVGEAEEVEVEEVGVLGLEGAEFVADGDGACGMVLVTKWDGSMKVEGGNLPLLAGVVGTPVMANLTLVAMVAVCLSAVLAFLVRRCVMCMVCMVV